MEEIYERLKKHWSYVYWCREKCEARERAWWNGYYEAIRFMLDYVRKLRKEQKVSENSLWK